MRCCYRFYKATKSERNSQLELRDDVEADVAGAAW